MLSRNDRRIIKKYKAKGKTLEFQDEISNSRIPENLRADDKGKRACIPFRIGQQK